MTKRILSFFLILGFLMPMVPVQVAASVEYSDDDLKAIVAEQFDAYVASLGPADASDAAWELVRHSVRNGGDLNMTADSHTFSRALMHTEMLRASVCNVLTAVHQAQISPSRTSICLRGTISWYQNVHYISNTMYDDQQDGDFMDDPFSTPLVRTREDPYTGPISNYDEAMYLVAGSVTTNYILQRTAVTEEAVTYRVRLTILDQFEFDGSYQGDDRELETLLNYLGKMLSLGMLHTYDLTINTEFEITLPNQCAHESSVYRWEYDGAKGLVNVTGNDLGRNPLSHNTTLAETGTVEQDVFRGVSYNTVIPARLLHDRPWSIEFRCSGDGSFSLSEGVSGDAGGVYIRKMKNNLLMGEAYFANETDENKTYFFYGIQSFSERGLNGVEEHTYRLTNRIFEDGSNMVYLYVDGVETGPMNESRTNGITEIIDWACGKDFSISFLGNSARPLDGVTMDYIQIWENGVDRAPFTYVTVRTLNPTCTEPGYTRKLCTLCGAVFEATELPATGHSFTEWEVFAAPDCTKIGMNSRSCTACGELETTVIPALGHQAITVPGTPATCTDSGLTEASHCGICGVTISEQEVIPALGHSFSSEITPADCLNPGFTTDTCTFCGFTQVRDEIPATGHAFGQWETVTEPTGKTEGEQRRFCHCGHFESQPIPKLPNPFTDVKESKYYYKAVLWAVENGITAGTSASRFSPDDPCTRAQVAVFIWRAEGKPEPKHTDNPFTDVKENKYFFQPILWAVENEITAGVGGGRFDPDAECTRSQIVTFLYRAMAEK